MVKDTRLRAERIADEAWMESLDQDMEVEEQRFEGSKRSDTTNEEINCFLGSSGRLATLRPRGNVRRFDFKRNGTDFYVNA